MLARTLAKARDEPLCVPHLRTPRLDRTLNPQVLVQAKKAVRAEIDHPPAQDHDLAARPGLVDHQVLQVRLGMLLAEPLDDSHKRVLAQRFAQFVHRAQHGVVVSLDSLGIRMSAGSHANLVPSLPGSLEMLTLKPEQIAQTSRFDGERSPPAHGPGSSREECDCNETDSIDTLWHQASSIRGIGHQGKEDCRT